MRALILSSAHEAWAGYARIRPGAERIRCAPRTAARSGARRTGAENAAGAAQLASVRARGLVRALQSPHTTRSAFVVLNVSFVQKLATLRYLAW